MGIIAQLTVLSLPGYTYVLSYLVADSYHRVTYYVFGHLNVSGTLIADVIMNGDSRQTDAGLLVRILCT